MNKSDGGLGWLLSKIERYSSKYPPTSANVGKRPLRAPRANHVFRTDQKRIRTENMVMATTRQGVGFSDNIAALRHLHQWQ